MKNSIITFLLFSFFVLLSCSKNYDSEFKKGRQGIDKLINAMNFLRSEYPPEKRELTMDNFLKSPHLNDQDKDLIRNWLVNHEITNKIGLKIKLNDLVFNQDDSNVQSIYLNADNYLLLTIKQLVEDSCFQSFNDARSDIINPFHFFINPFEYSFFPDNYNIAINPNQYNFKKDIKDSMSYSKVSYEDLRVFLQRYTDGNYEKLKKEISGFSQNDYNFELIFSRIKSLKYIIYIKDLVLEYPLLSHITFKSGCYAGKLIIYDISNCQVITSFIFLSSSSKSISTFNSEKFGDKKMRQTKAIEEDLIVNAMINIRKEMEKYIR